MAEHETEQTVSARIVDLLRAEGVDTIFGVPDPNYAEIHRIAREAGMKLVAPRHEAAGGFMADALSRMTGCPQVVMAAPGPGVANMLPAVVCASKENVPVVFVGPQRERVYDAAVRRSKFQYSPQIRLFEPAVKYAAVVEFPHQVDEVFHEAFRRALGGTPGPVYVELPLSTIIQRAPYPVAPAPDQYRLVEPDAPQARVEEAAELLVRAKLPVILAGTGVHTSRGHRELAQLAEQLGCAVVTTYGGRGALPETHLQVHTFGSPQALEATCGADVLLAVGTSIGEQLHYGRGERYYGAPGSKRWIHLEREPQAIGVNRPVDVPLVGDLRSVLPQLRTALEARGPFSASPEVARWRDERVALRRQIAETAPDTAPVHPGRAMLEVRAALPDDAVIVRDGGCTSLWELAYFELRCNDYLWTSKFGHLGTGLPYAIGAQLCVGPERRVCLITGDSAFGFHVMELETAVRHRLPIVTVVNYDQGWGMELDAYDAQGGFDELRHAFVRLDDLARSMGAHGEFCEKTDQIGPAIERALASGKPAVVQVVTDMEVNARQAPNWQEFASWYGFEGAY
jgi:thiamine pyrophosphate-dependent acetolactate synthase large subunit-like protein